jgi:hypothetical protein
VDDFALAGLEPVAALAGGGGGVADAASGVSAGGGGEIDCGPETAGTVPCEASGLALVEVAFIEAQPETATKTRNPTITGRRIDGSIAAPKAGFKIDTPCQPCGLMQRILHLEHGNA